MMKVLVTLLLTCVSDVLLAPGHHDVECQYLSQHREMVCHCTRHHLTLTSLDQILTTAHGAVESFKIEECRSVEVGMNMRRVQQPFYQLRLENIDNVRIHDMVLGQDDQLDIVVRSGVRVSVSGGVTCHDCDHLSAQPSLMIQVQDTNTLNLDHLHLTSVKLRVNTRSVATVSINSSVLETLVTRSVEIWYSDQVTISHTTVSTPAQSQAISLNHVNKVKLDHTLGINSTSLNIMSPDTQVETQCTAQFDIREEVIPWSWSAPECGSLDDVLDSLDQQHQRGFDHRTGTIVMVTVCALVVVTVIGALCILNRKGKLDGLL